MTPQPEKALDFYACVHDMVFGLWALEHRGLIKNYPSHSSAPICKIIYVQLSSAREVFETRLGLGEA